jgi:hypothetical protein
MCAQTYNNYCQPFVKYLLIRTLISIIKNFDCYSIYLFSMLFRENCDRRNDGKSKWILRWISINCGVFQTHYLIRQSWADLIAAKRQSLALHCWNDSSELTQIQETRGFVNCGISLIICLDDERITQREAL